MKKLLLILLFVFVFVITGCQEPEVQEKLISITVNGSEKLYIGDEATYETVFDPDNYSNKGVTWSSSDETKLIIDQETGVASALNETKEEGIFVYATSIDQPNIKGSKKIFIYKPESSEPVYPNLQGYTITIAQSETNLSDYDPFLENYSYADKKFKQEAWKEVEKDFNCKIEVKPYPSHAEWGPSRWNYILRQAENKTSDFDFLIVPDSKIYHFAEVDAILSLEDFYVLHGNSMMNETFIESGTYNDKLYTFSTTKNEIEHVLYYNINLFEELKEINPNLMEPAQIFLDGNWTYSVFLEYCKEVQNTMAILYNEKGVAGSEAQEYYAMAGWDAYLWLGLSTNDGEPIVDIKNQKANIATPHKEQSADIVKELYTKHYADPQQNINQNVTSWNDGRAFFNSGFTLASAYMSRQNDSLNEIKYGYVPWPRANDLAFEDIKVALGGNPSTFVMPIGRNYEGYGEDCNPENIYWALTEVYRRTQENMNMDDMEASNPYDVNKFTDSEASQSAYIYIHNLMANGKGYFDPMVTPDNPVLMIQPGYQPGYHQVITIKNSLAKYNKGEVETWEEAVAPIIPVIVEGIRRAFYK